MSVNVTTHKSQVVDLWCCPPLPPDLDRQMPVKTLRYAGGKNIL